MSVFTHAWGKSKAADRVFEYVVGLTSASAERLNIVALQVYCDESWTEKNFVIAGHMATAEDWVKFSKEWEGLLPLSNKNDQGVFRFKHSEIIKRADAEWRLKAYKNCIGNHIDKHVCLILNLESIKRAASRIRVGGRCVDVTGSWIRLALPPFINTLCSPESNNLTERDLSFVFDENSDAKILLQTWFENKKERIRHWGIDIGTPKFEKEEKFMPLQAADFWAGEVRSAYDREEKSTLSNYWDGYGRPHLHVTMETDDDSVFFHVLDLVKSQYDENLIEIV